MLANSQPGRHALNPKCICNHKEGQRGQQNQRMKSTDSERTQYYKLVNVDSTWFSILGRVKY